MGAVVALCSLSGAPGVSTLAVALAGMWPQEVPAVVVEADASGGDVAAWWQMPSEPGLVELAAAVRHEAGAAGGADPVQCSRETPGGLRVCAAPATAQRAGTAVELLARHPHALRPGGEAVAVVDLGRLAPRSAAASLACSADAVVVVTRDEVAQLKRLKDSLPGLRSGLAHLGVSVVGERESPAEIAEVLQVPVWGRIPPDARGAALVRGERAEKRPQRRPLPAAARDLGRRLVEEAGAHRRTEAGRV